MDKPVLREKYRIRMYKVYCLPFVVGLLLSIAENIKFERSSSWSVMEYLPNPFWMTSARFVRFSRTVSSNSSTPPGGKIQGLSVSGRWYAWPLKGLKFSGDNLCLMWKIEAPGLMIKRTETTTAKKKVTRKVMRKNFFIGELACYGARIILLMSPGGDRANNRGWMFPAHRSKLNARLPFEPVLFRNFVLADFYLRESYYCIGCWSGQEALGLIHIHDVQTDWFLMIGWPICILRFQIRSKDIKFTEFSLKIWWRYLQGKYLSSDLIDIWG